MVYYMGYITVSAKIPEKLKKMLDEYGIKPGTVIRKALEEELRKKILEEIEEELRSIVKDLPEISDEEIVRLIRGNREER